MKHLLVILSLLLASCSLEYKIELFNNCGILVTVYSGDKRYQIAPNTATLIEPSVDQVMKVIVGKSELIFRDRSPWPPKLYHQRGFNSVTVKFQINDDLRIYAATIEETFPLINSHSQPIGFPLSPASDS